MDDKEPGERKNYKKRIQKEERLERELRTATVLFVPNTKDGLPGKEPAGGGGEGEGHPGIQDQEQHSR